jgi:hypothetical protein
VSSGFVTKNQFQPLPQSHASVADKASRLEKLMFGVRLARGLLAE